MKNDLTKAMYQVGIKGKFVLYTKPMQCIYKRYLWHSRRCINKCVGNKEDVSRKTAQLLVNNIEDAIAKYFSEKTFTHTQSQTSYTALFVAVVYRPKINVIRISTHHYVSHSFCFIYFSVCYYLIWWNIIFVVSIVKDFSK